MGDEFGCFFAGIFFVFCVDGDGVSILVFHHFHTGDVGVTVADVDHVTKWHWSFILGNILIDGGVVVGIVDAFVDAEEVLCFGGIVDGDGGPFCDLVLIVFVS